MDENFDRDYWNGQAETYDDEPDHGLRNPRIRQACFELLGQCLPKTPASILDIGCGTGSLSLLMADMNHQVLGIDSSEAMIARAEQKSRTAGHSIAFRLMDAHNPQLNGELFKVIVCRHLLWTMPSLQTALQNCSSLLMPEGRFVLIEGFWHTGGGLHLEQVIEALPPGFTVVKFENLSNVEALWGAKVLDERYLVVADYHPLDF